MISNEIRNEDKKALWERVAHISRVGGTACLSQHERGARTG